MCKLKKIKSKREIEMNIYDIVKEANILMSKYLNLRKLYLLHVIQKLCYM